MGEGGEELDHVPAHRRLRVGGGVTQPHKQGVAADTAEENRPIKFFLFKKNCFLSFSVRRTTNTVSWVCFTVNNSGKEYLQIHDDCIAGGGGEEPGHAHNVVVSEPGQQVVLLPRLVSTPFPPM